MTKRYAALVIIAATALLVAMLLLKPQRPGIEHGVVFNPEQLNVLRTWAACHYTPIDHGAKFRDAVHTIRILANTSRFDDRTARALRGAILDFLYAYHDGTYEAYSRFALPVTNIALTPEAERNRVNMLQTLKERLNPQADFSVSGNDPKSVLRSFWELCNGPYDRSALGNDADYFRTDFLEGVALEQSEAHILEGTTPPSLALHFSEDANLGFFRDTVSVTFLPSVSSLVARDGSVVFAIVRLQLKSKSDPPMPVLVLYYYAPDYEKWLPLELGIPYSPRRRHGYLM